MNTTCSNTEVVDKCDVLFITVKPHLMKGILTEIHDHIKSHHLVISVAMAWTIALLEKVRFSDSEHVINTVYDNKLIIQWPYC